MRLSGHRLEFSLFGDVGLERDRRAALGADHINGLLRRCEIVIHA